MRRPLSRVSGCRRYGYRAGVTLRDSHRRPRSSDNWLILLGLIVWLVIRLLPGSSGRIISPTGEAALAILDHRLACGEIDPPEWNAQRVALLAASGDKKWTPDGILAAREHVQLGARMEAAEGGARVGVHSPGAS